MLSTLLSDLPCPGNRVCRTGSERDRSGRTSHLEGHRPATLSPDAHRRTELCLAGRGEPFSGAHRHHRHRHSQSHCRRLDDRGLDDRGGCRHHAGRNLRLRSPIQVSMKKRQRPGPPISEKAGQYAKLGWVRGGDEFAFFDKKEVLFDPGPKGKFHFIHRLPLEQEPVSKPRNPGSGPNPVERRGSEEPGWRPKGFLRQETPKKNNFHPFRAVVKSAVPNEPCTNPSPNFSDKQHFTVQTPPRLPGRFLSAPFGALTVPRHKKCAIRRMAVGNAKIFSISIR